MSDASLINLAELTSASAAITFDSPILLCLAAADKLMMEVGKERYRLSVRSMRVF